MSRKPGLSSIAAPTGRNAIGPSDVSARGALLFTVGLGADPALRAQLPPLPQQASGWLSRDKRHGWRQVADIAGFEATANPDGKEPDSNPQSLLDETGALIRVGRDGSQKIVASAGLVAPGGLAIRGRSAYVSNCGTCVGAGTVVRIPL